MHLETFSKEFNFHFSIDDVFVSLIQATLKYERLFDHPFFSFLNQLHCIHGINIDLYLFFEDQLDSTIYSLEDVSDRFIYEFQKANWLTLGPHALNMNIAPYQQTPESQIQAFNKIYTQINRFAGKDKTSTALRLHYFSESYYLYNYWQAKKVNTFLLTDKSATSYHLPESQRLQLAKTGQVNYKHINLRRSHFRIENLIHQSPPIIKNLLSSRLLEHNYLTLFSHEIDLNNSIVRDRCHLCIKESLAILPRSC